MKIAKLLFKNSINLDAAPKTKLEAIDVLVDLMANSGNLSDKESFKQKVIEREKLGTTGIGGCIAIPHGKSDAVKNTAISAMVVKDGVDFEAMDGEKVKLFFLIGVNDKANDEHLKVLSALSTMLMDDDFKDRLIKAATTDEFMKIIDDEENERLNKNKESLKSYDILAVTACPT